MNKICYHFGFFAFFRNAFFVDENESVIGDTTKKSFSFFLNDVRGKTFALVKTDDGVEEQMVS